MRQVSPWDVPLRKRPVGRDVNHQLQRLKDEGQIEPIALLSNGFADLDSWAYAEAQIEAARNLGWPTILVTP